jgi:glutathione S-transferase
MKLVIGNKNYSSWSLRAWLLLSANEIPFEEIRVPLSQSDSQAELRKYSDAAKVPVLLDEDTVIWDSLAINEYISEQYLEGQGWPNDPIARAIARSCCAEMHSSFFSIREKMPMNCRALGREIEIDQNLGKEILRVDSLWTEIIQQYSNDGSGLFGEFTIADCMFAPIVFRFNTYNVEISDIAQNYVNKMLDHPSMQNWLSHARAEKEMIEIEELGM